MSVDGLPGSPDVCVIELGGTVGQYSALLLFLSFRFLYAKRDGELIDPASCFMHYLLAGDIESMPFIEALRQFQFRVGECI